MNLFPPGNSCVVGLQWGDEGKGKVVDFLADSVEFVARYCGGANAGHTVRIGDQKYATHLLPVGVFRKGVMNVIGNGVVLDPEKLLTEIDELNGRGIAVSPANLRVSYKAHVVMPYHKAEDGAREMSAEGAALGTTRRGIGPTYAEKMHRSSAIRVADLINEGSLKRKVFAVIEQRNKILSSLYGVEPLNPAEVYATFRSYGQRLKPFVADTGKMLIDAFRAKKGILFEGAHAALLDVDHGTYPYVTSSNCSSLGLFTGAGVPPQTVQNFIGIMKAYSTRVGAGPFPTEQDNDIGNRIRDRGNEYGTTTRRPRRCGYFDAVAVRYAADLCGATHLTLTMLDVLSGFDSLQVAVGYKSTDGSTVEYFPADAEMLSGVTPVYETLPGWKEEISHIRKFEELPANAKAYVARLEALVGVPIRLVGVGPDRNATLVR